MFSPVDNNQSFSEREEQILKFWKSQQIYHKSLDARENAPPFVFYEGPPTANGMPHPGHCLTRAIKDLFPRYRTMRGYRCERKAGWDTHGLPVEVEVCKELGIHSKEEIEAYGVEPFIHLCQQSVWRYMQEWERLTERLGFWVDLEKAYVTYYQSYVESVWWSLKNLFDRGLLYQGHKIVWWWAQGGTALSSGEVGQGYREVADPSVFVKFPLLDHQGDVSGTSLLVWTTTPWTLPSNQFVAVNPNLSYAEIIDEETNEKLIVAEELLDTLAEKAKRTLKKVHTNSGAALIGKPYLPPFGCFREPHLKAEKASTVKSGEWHIVAAEFVTTDSGTGLVHIAPAFGEDDYNVLLEVQNEYEDGGGPQLINCVAPDGKFTDEAPEFVRGRWVKDCDKDLTRDLKSRGLLFHQEQYRHDYPFCWRAEEDPLIQYPRESWFIRTTQYKDRMLENNSQIRWLPEHIKTGRFGKFLESNVDWALSRERYWGTPLPIWVCEETGQMEAVGSYKELLEKPGATGTEAWEEAKAANPELPNDLRVHKPYIDAVTYDSPFAKNARMRRVPEVIDCWYDSGAMPFAQWGFRGQVDGVERDRFEEQFPADFISEALDQTRGWFYSQLAISTLLFSEERGARSEERDDTTQYALRNPHSYPHPFRNCIVLGLMLGEDGQKMSKSKRNYRAPNEIFDLYGADALRWYFFANQPPWTSIRYSEQAIKDSIPEFLLRLWNVYSFFTIYANIDEFNPAQEFDDDSDVGELMSENLWTADSHTPLQKRSELDRWVISELNRTVATVIDRMDHYDNFGACQAITRFVDALSNWYVRRSRDRYWAKEQRSVDKLDAYWTLYECLLTTSKIIAPFVPYLAESLWQNLAVAVFQERVPESVHLCHFPKSDELATDDELSVQMNLVREISSLGRQARSAAELKVRQPLSKVEVVLANEAHHAWLHDHSELIAEELNVKSVEFTTQGEEYINYSIVPNFKRLGPKLGKNMPVVKKLLAEADGAQLLGELKQQGRVILTIPEGESIQLDADDIEVRLQAKEGWAAAQGSGVVVVLATEITEDLYFEGLVNDLMRFIQDKRKELNCDFTDRISIALLVKPEGEDSFEDFLSKIEPHRERIRADALAEELQVQNRSSQESEESVKQLTSVPYAPQGLNLGSFWVDVLIKR